MLSLLSNLKDKKIVQGCVQILKARKALSHLHLRFSVAVILPLLY